MSNFKPHPVLESIVKVIRDVISGIEIEYVSDSMAVLKDGNDTIHIQQESDTNTNLETISIKDPKDIIYSEDLWPVLAKLKTATIIINGLNIETHLIFQAVKDGFDVISNSYEFVRHIEREVTKVKSIFKFGNHFFIMAVMKEAGSVLVIPEFASKFDPAVRPTVENDALKVQKAVSAMLKENKLKP